ncbi:hypothetical protein U1Q18_047287, partial [Sarracenia purpurea var. burkii]
GILQQGGYGSVVVGDNNEIDLEESRSVTWHTGNRGVDFGRARLEECEVAKTSSVTSPGRQKVTKTVKAKKDLGSTVKKAPTKKRNYRGERSDETCPALVFLGFSKPRHLRYNPGEKPVAGDSFVGCGFGRVEDQVAETGDGGLGQNRRQGFPLIGGSVLGNLSFFR